MTGHLPPRIGRCQYRRDRVAKSATDDGFSAVLRSVPPSAPPRAPRPPPAPYASDRPRRPLPVAGGATASRRGCPVSAYRPSRSTTCARTSSAATARAASGRAAACRAARRQLPDRPRRVRRDPRAERLGQVDARPPALDAAAARRRQRRGVRDRRVRKAAGRPAPGQPGVSRGVVLQAHVAGREPQLLRPVLRARAAPRPANGSRRSCSRSASRRSGATSRWRTSRGACSRRSRWRARC